MYARESGRQMFEIKQNQRKILDQQQRRSSTSKDGPDVHPMFEQPKYEMPLPNAAAFFDFEKRLEHETGIMDHLVRTQLWILN